ncbi:MAG: hypothetical protein IPJ18_19000 [Betaproteobacteria bacterium]|nr:hypothetical protein [Betaproteobacteria bacterium]
MAAAHERRVVVVDGFIACAAGDGGASPGAPRRGIACLHALASVDTA